MPDDSKMIMTVGTLMIFMFVFFALTFGMSDWSAKPPLTASAPAAAPHAIPR